MWLLAKNQLNGWSNYYKPGINLMDRPFTMMMGDLLWFFRDNGVLFSSTSSMTGQLRVRLHRQGVNAQFYPFGEAKQKAFLQHFICWQEAFERAFEEVQRAATAPEELPEDIGPDRERFVEEAIHSTPDGTTTEAPGMR